MSKKYQRVIIQQINVDDIGPIFIGIGVEFNETIPLAQNIEIYRAKLSEIRRRISHSARIIVSKSLSNTSEISEAVSDYQDASEETF
jgi:hypothetical protein